MASPMPASTPGRSSTVTARSDAMTPPRVPRLCRLYECAPGVSMRVSTGHAPPLTWSAMRIGICTGGGDVPGLNPCIKAVVGRVAEAGHEVVGIRRGWAGLLETDPDDAASVQANIVALDPPTVRTINRTGGTILHTSRTNPDGSRRPACRRSSPTGSTGDGPHDLTRSRAARARPPRPRRPDPDRRRRHAVLRAAPARRGRARHRHPEDDGQRRPRHRLLHRLLHRRHARGRVHPRPADVDRLARADRRRRAVRPLQRRDVARSPPTSPAPIGR